MKRQSKTVSGVTAYLFAVVLAVAVSMALCTWVVGSVNLWVVMGVALVSGLLGSLTSEQLGDAIMFTIIAGIVTVVAAFAFGSIPVIWKQVWLSGYAGMCAGKLVLGAYGEFFATH
jgi:hypothetical protein